MHHKVHDSSKLDLREESDSGKKRAEDSPRRAFACWKPQETVGQFLMNVRAAKHEAEKFGCILGREKYIRCYFELIGKKFNDFKEVTGMFIYCIRI